MRTHIIFTGFSKNVFTALWSSDGTVSGTHQLDVPGVDGRLGHTPFAPENFTPLGNKMMFTTWDRLGGPPEGGMQVALWVTDGTAAGTYEVGGDYEAGIKGIGGHVNDSYGLQPSGFVGFGDHVLFFGRDAGQQSGMWVTDGTAKGTFELGGYGSAGIKNASSTGLQAKGFVALGDSLFFEGIDKTGHDGLWMTDGTTKGTVELGGLANAGVNGLKFVDLDGDSPTAVGGKLFFHGYDSDLHKGLWVTDGTAKGTFELGGIGQAGPAQPSSFSGTPLTEFQGKLLLLGGDLNGSNGLWVSDGTSAGTQFVAPTNSFYDFTVITGHILIHDLDGLRISDGTSAGSHLVFKDDGKTVAGSGSFGVGLGELTGIGDKAVFTGADANDNLSLWVTDGTVKGTVEIGGLNNAGIKNAESDGLQPSDFIAAGDKAYFTGRDAEGTVSFWVTDGTAAGTHELEHVKGASVHGLSPLDIGVLPSAIAASMNASPIIASGGIRFSGEIIDDLTVKSLKLLDGAKQLAIATVQGDSWSVSTRLGKGTYDDLHVIATDAKGRTDQADAGFNLEIGASARDHLSGNSGRDFIEGLKGGDTLTGGKGADTFIFTTLADSKTAAAGRDTIADFKHAEHDRIDLRSIDANSGVKGDQAFHFVGEHAFKHHAGELRSDVSGGNTVVSGDVDGDGKADFAILLHGNVTLHSGDFFL